jgi:hypothetical protein
MPTTNDLSLHLYSPSPFPLFVGQGHPSPLISVTCSHIVPDIASQFRVSFGLLKTLRCVPSDMIHVTVIRAGAADASSQEVALKGRIQVTYKPDAQCNQSERDTGAYVDRNATGYGNDQNPNLRVYQEDLRLTFLPERHGIDALFPGDEVGREHSL